MGFVFDYCCRSHTGRRRRTNQDNFLVDGTRLDPREGVNETVLNGRTRPPQLFGVFDGMGGEACGETAAFLAADEAAGFRPGREPEKELETLCRRANSRIAEYADEHGIGSMGTTAAMILFLKKRAYVCNVGDSRVYRFSGDALEKLSVDHVSELPFHKKPALSQNLGMPEDLFAVEPSISSHSVTDGDVFLICSDGLTDMVSEERIRGIVAANCPASAADGLLAEALSNGGRDNVTVLLIKAVRKGLFS